MIAPAELQTNRSCTRRVSQGSWTPLAMACSRQLTQSRMWLLLMSGRRLTQSWTASCKRLILTVLVDRLVCFVVCER